MKWVKEGTNALIPIRSRQKKLRIKLEQTQTSGKKEEEKIKTPQIQSKVIRWYGLR